MYTAARAPAPASVLALDFEEFEQRHAITGGGHDP
jgi:hypothetical protein